MEELEIVKTIDTSLKYLETLEPSRTFVFKVSKNGSIYVLKTALHTKDWEINHLKREREVLKLAEEVSGITHLVNSYNDTEFYKNSILKEFFRGKNLWSLNRKISDTNLQKDLERTVYDLHSLGIARLDLSGRNVVVSPNGKKASIIDLGYCLFWGTHSSLEFEAMKSEDFKNLEENILG